MLMIALAASMATSGQPADMALVAQSDVAQVVQDAQDQKQKPPRYNRFRRNQLKDLQIVELKLGTKLQHKFTTWVMDVEDKRQEGMMFLEAQDVAKNQAMIFVFKEDEVLGFWMKNTLIPLDIAYVTSEGTIVKTYTMRAHDTISDYGSRSKAMYAIEFRSGTFKKLGIKTGQKVEIPDTVKAKN